MTEVESKAPEPREEQEVFADLEVVCCSHGYIHALAFLNYRDNFIALTGDALTVDDLLPMYSHDRLIRSEMSTLAGLMVKKAVDCKVPEPSLTADYIKKSDELLAEIHMC